MLASYEGVSAASEILDPRSLSVSESLVDYVTKEKSELVVCGTRGLGGFERMLLGSVSSNLATYAPSSVMIVRRPKMSQGKIRFSRILVATDGSQSSSKGVGLAIGLAKALSSKLTFVNVVYLPPLSYTLGEGSWFDQAMAEYREEAKKIVNEAVSIAKENGVEADSRVLDELRSPVVAITKLAEEGRYDLITVGTRGLGGFKKLALGSVASGVVHYAHCSVLVAK
jgi:nucleotide-binding universal stress UspA family protein